MPLLTKQAWHDHDRMCQISERENIKVLIDKSLLKIKESYKVKEYIKKIEL